jgi:hypothetical protein
MQLSNPLRLEFAMRESYRRLAQSARDQANIACRGRASSLFDGDGSRIEILCIDVITRRFPPNCQRRDQPGERRDRDDPEDLGAERRGLTLQTRQYTAPCCVPG